MADIKDLYSHLNVLNKIADDTIMMNGKDFKNLYSNLAHSDPEPKRPPAIIIELVDIDEREFILVRKFSIEGYSIKTEIAIHCPFCESSTVLGFFSDLSGYTSYQCFDLKPVREAIDEHLTEEHGGY